MTERLYYADAYCTRFSAHVIERLTWDGHPAVVLNRTAFYPASGGQPADLGILGGVAVLDVIAREEDGAIVHVLERAPAAGDVEGEIDWPRRFDHMQQHTGQHILSAAFEREFDADTVGFHLGAEASTVDIAAARLEPGAAVAIEALVNRVVWADRTVGARFVGAEELAALPLRRPPVVEGDVRVVEIADPNADAGSWFDVNPCGGTHVARTGEIGLIKIVRLDYRGDETRVEFLCGGRALRDYAAKHAVLGQLAARLTVGYWELDAAVERLQGEAKQSRQDLRRARQQLLQMEAVELSRVAITRGPYRVVQRVWGEPVRPPEELRLLAQELAQSCGAVALLAAIGERTHLCFACGEGGGLDVAELLRGACARLEGKGGGQPHLAQGSAPAADPARVEAVLAEILAGLEGVIIEGDA